MEEKGDAAEAALLAGSIQEAKGLAEADLARDPESIHARLTLGEIALEEQRFMEALDRANSVLRQETDEADASVLASLAYARTGQYDRAIDALNRTLRHARIAQRASLGQMFPTSCEPCPRKESNPSRKCPIP